MCAGVCFFLSFSAWALPTKHWKKHPEGGAGGSRDCCLAGGVGLDPPGGDTSKYLRRTDSWSSIVWSRKVGQR